MGRLVPLGCEVSLAVTSCRRLSIPDNFGVDLGTYSSRSQHIVSVRLYSHATQMYRGNKVRHQLDSIRPHKFRSSAIARYVKNGTKVGDSG
jgi:hypothetical protein